MVKEHAKFWALIFALVLLVPGAVWAQTPADAVADAVANSGAFPAGTTVLSVTVDGANAVIDLSVEAVSGEFGDTQSDAMVKAIVNSLGEFSEITAVEVTAAGAPLWQYLPPSSAPDGGSGGPTTQSLSGARAGFQGGIAVNNVGYSGAPVTPLTSELAGKLVALHPSHGSYWHQGYGYWFRAMRTLCGPNPSPPRPPGWTGSVYHPSNYYYWTMGWQWGSYYEDDMSPEVIRFLKAYCESAGAETWVSRNLDRNAGNFPVPYNGKYPSCSFPLPRWQTAAKYYLEERGDVPQWVWDEPALSAQSDKDIRARPYYANYRMEQGGYAWQDCVSFHLHSNASTSAGGQAQARGTETYWYTTMYPYLQTAAVAFCNAVESQVISMIRNEYDGYWAEDMYVTGTTPPEWYTPYGTYRGYQQQGNTNTRWQDRGVKTSNFGEIREAKMPAQLMELLFHDDWKFYPDHVFHQDQVFRSTVAWGVYRGICNYFGRTPKPMTDASVESVSFPSLVGPNVAVNGTVTMKDLGMAWCWGDKWLMGLLYVPYTPWKLQATVDDQFGAAGTKIEIPDGDPIYTTETATFDISLTSPATTGLYTTSWRMIKDDLEGGSFGAVASAQIQVDADPPVITIASPAAQDYAYGCVTAGFSATDALSEVVSLTANIDGTPVSNGQLVSWLALGAHTLTVTAVDTFGNSATESVTFNVVNSVGKVTIGGWIELENKKGTCGFNCEYIEGAPAPTGHLTYQDHDTGMTVKSVNMVAMGIVGNQAWFSGTCTIEGQPGHWFRVDVTDNGEPGSNDVFNIQLDTGYSKGGKLGGGNVTIH